MDETEREEEEGEENEEKVQQSCSTVAGLYQE